MLPTHVHALKSTGAISVKNELVSQGVRADHIRVKGSGADGIILRICLPTALPAYLLRSRTVVPRTAQRDKWTQSFLCTVDVMLDCVRLVRCIDRSRWACFHHGVED